jgi:hypothetical protein
MAVVPHPQRLKPLLPREVVTTEPSMCSDVNATIHCFQAGEFPMWQTSVITSSRKCRSFSVESVVTLNLRLTIIVALSAVRYSSVESMLTISRREIGPFSRSHLCD